MPWWAIGNPFGPLPTDGKFYYTDPNRNHERVGPFDTKAEAKTHLDASSAGNQ